MHNHPGSLYALQNVSKMQRAETLHIAERNRLANSVARSASLRLTTASTLRWLADRVAPRPSEAPLAGGC